MQSKCNLCEKRWITSIRKAPYICPDCDDRIAEGLMPRKKTILLKHWKKKGLIE